MPDDCTRRRFLSTAAAVAGGSVVTTSLASARYDNQPEFVDLTFDRDRLERYQPLLDLSDVDIRPTITYAWVAESSEQDTDMLVYWVFYPEQEGVTEADSHYPDREPIYLEVAQDGSIEAVHYDEIHWSARTVYEPRADDTHVSLRVVAPWHPYKLQPDTSEGVLEPGIESLHDRYSGWLSNGWPVATRTVVNPWTLPTRGHWWDGGLDGIALEAVRTDLFRGTPLGIPFRET